MNKHTLLKIVSSFLLTLCLCFMSIGSAFAYTSQATPQASNDKSVTPVLNEEWIDISTLNAMSSPDVKNQVQVFDVKQGHVVKTLDNSSKIQKQVKRILKHVYEFAPEVQPDMKAKYIIRIPVKKGTAIKLNDNSISIKELFIFYYVDKEPLLLVFDENKKPFLFHTKQSIEPLLNAIEVE